MNLTFAFSKYLWAKRLFEEIPPAKIRVFMDYKFPDGTNKVTAHSIKVETIKRSIENKWNNLSASFRCPCKRARSLKNVEFYLTYKLLRLPPFTSSSFIFSLTSFLLEHFLALFFLLSMWWQRDFLFSFSNASFHLGKFCKYFRGIIPHSERPKELKSPQNFITGDFIIVYKHLCYHVIVSD